MVSSELSLHDAQRRGLIAGTTYFNPLFRAGRVSDSDVERPPSLTRPNRGSPAG